MSVLALFLNLLFSSRYSLGNCHEHSEQVAATRGEWYAHKKNKSKIVCQIKPNELTAGMDKSCRQPKTEREVKVLIAKGVLLLWWFVDDDDDKI